MVLEWTKGAERKVQQRNQECGEEMSAQHQLNPPAGKIDQISLLSEHIGALYLSDEYSDVTLIIEGQRFEAHKVILAARSHYFRGLLFSGLKESTQREVELKDGSLVAFKKLLKYIYTGRLSFGGCKEEVILETLWLTHLYGFTELESSIFLCLKEILSIMNVCLIFDAALCYKLDSLTKICCEYMDKHAVELINHESVLQLSSHAMNQLIARDSFHAAEIEIFLAVQKWIKANPGLDAESVLSKLRLSLVTINDLLNIVRPTGLFSPDAILDAIAIRTQARDTDLPYRGRLVVDENVALPSLGAQVLQGEMRGYLLDGDSSTYDMERGYTRHTITKSQRHGILLKLGGQYIINHIRMLLWDLDMRSYTYYVEVSADQKDWVRVINYTNYYCRSWQYLYFEPRVVVYIRIVGTNNTVNKVFHLVSFEAYYTSKMEKLHEDIVIPTTNVARLERSAIVREGICRSRNNLLNGDTVNYDADGGYTCHQLGCGSILIQFGQPYYIESMRLLLWDCDKRSYSYYIEVSGDSFDWELVCDKTKEACRSWQTIRLNAPRAVVFVRIIGVHNTVNEAFHCVHFECPAQTEEKPAVPSDPVLPDKASTNSLAIEDEVKGAASCEEPENSS